MASAPSKNHEQPQGERSRILRIGVILGGKIVEERLLRQRQDVTIGQSAKNTFSVPVSGLPRRWTLFAVRNGRYFLTFANNMDGRVSDGSGVRTLIALKQSGAKRRGHTWVVPLNESARGKIVVGEMTLLFQFVTEPPRQPRPHLPASVRGTFTDRLDPMLSIIMAISLLIHFSIGLFAYQRDRVIKKRTTRIFNETFQRPTVAAQDIQLTPPTEKADKKADKGDKDSKKKEKKAAAKKSPDKGKKGKGDKGKSDQPPGRSAEERAQLEEDARRYAENLLADAFGDRGVGGGSSDRDPRNDLGQAIEDIKRSGAQVEIGGGSRRGTRGDGSSQIGTGKGPQVEGPGGSTTKTEAKTREKVPRTRVKVGGGRSDDDTTLSPDAVLRKIRTAYMNGLKRCHKDLLKRDPSSGGTVGLKFTVGPSGRVVRVKAKGFDPGVDRCIERRAKSWRFGIPKDEDGEPTDAGFQVSLVLQAE